MRELKNSLREILRRKKEAMLPEERLLKSQKISGHLMEIIRHGETVMVFTSKEKEVNTKPLILSLFKEGNPVIVPIIVKEDVSLRLSYLRDFSALVPSTFGVPEPIGSEIPAMADEIDTIILPMLGFDRKGGRIGYGAGYYDRFLAKNRNLRTIGVAFGCQEVGSVPVDENDVPMDCIITEDGIVYPEGGRGMEINGTTILDTFAEAFPVWLSRVIITAATPEWAYKAAVEATGFATSKIGCSCEAGIERYLAPEETPDGRAGISILICADKKNMKANVAARISQCILPTPTTSAFDGLPGAASRFYTRMHYFGDRYEERCMVGGRSCWKIPVMEGDYIGEERFGTVKGIAGGNFLIMGRDRESALAGAVAAIKKITGMPGVITSFAGGIVGSGSKVGCKNYHFPMPASTSHRWCPGLKNQIPDSLVPDGVTSIYEIVLNGIDESAIQDAMRTGIRAACETGTVLYIGASNFDGKLGQYRISLHDLFR